MILWTPDLGPPTDFACIGYGLSNAFFEIDPGTEERLRTERVWTGYAGWNFFGRVWLDAEGAFSCQVLVRGEPQATVRAGTLGELMHEVSRQWGYD